MLDIIREVAFTFVTWLISIQFNAPFIEKDEVFKQLENSDLVVVDTRSNEEFELSHISGAIHFYYKKKEINNLVRKIPKGSKVVVYCSIGYRSAILADRLLERGLSVANLQGGLFRWFKSGLPAVDSQQNVMTEIHGYNWFWGLLR